jgi:hypothetical protein
MKPNKWKSVSNPVSEKEYLALLSYLPLKKYTKIPAVVKYSAQIEKQLQETKGLIGFAFQAELLKKQFWTLSVWENGDALNEFIGNLPHSEIMIKLSPYMNHPTFTDWKIKGSEVPPDWEEAKKRRGK